MPSESQIREASRSTSPSRLSELSEHRDKAVRTAVAQNPATPSEVLERLVADKHHLPRYGVAENSDPGAWEIALRAHDLGVRVILAQRHDLGGRTLQRLLGDPEHEVRDSLATSSDRAEVIAALARDEDARVRSTAALSKVLTQEDLELLADDSAAKVRATAVQSRRLSAETVLRLVRDRSYMVRYELLWARPERVDIAEMLRNDKERIVADLAQDCLDPPHWMMQRLADLAVPGNTLP